MYYHQKNTKISTVSQPEDKHHRFDYEKMKCEELSGIRGSEMKISDSR